LYFKSSKKRLGLNILEKYLSQVHAFPNVGIYLPRHVFSHDQLYVALSRGISQNSTKVLIKEGKIEGEDEDFTKNVVFKDILLSQS